MRPPRIVHFNGAEHCLHIPPDRAAPRIRNRGCGAFSWPTKRDGDSDPDKRAMRRDGIYTCTKNASSEEMIVRKSQTVEDTETDNIKKKKEEESSLLLFYMPVCILYALCIHPQLHTFTAPQPYGHAYSRFCMHCMQSFSELCVCIACIVAFLMHTMHTSRMGWQSAMTVECDGDRDPKEQAMRLDGSVHA